MLPHTEDLTQRYQIVRKDNGLVLASYASIAEAGRALYLAHNTGVVLYIHNCDSCYS